MTDKHPHRRKARKSWLATHLDAVRPHLVEVVRLVVVLLWIYEQLTNC